MFGVSGFEEDSLTWSPDKKQPNLDEYKEFNQKAQAHRKSVSQKVHQNSFGMHGEVSSIENIDVDSRRQLSRVETMTSGNGEGKNGGVSSGPWEGFWSSGDKGVSESLQSAYSMVLTGSSFLDVRPSVLKSLMLGGHLQGVGCQLQVGGTRQELNQLGQTKSLPLIGRNKPRVHESSPVNCGELFTAVNFFIYVCSPGTKVQKVS
ncbi:hypothetical protein K438DRAFT_2117906 [Mycena galopus ATCC 62051]|nr:hypothetical protein K438DRAFT_2117906 [Mycena galopus ATCC 62051]